ncbi:MAG: sulfatase [Planctomycetota bacterium]
MTWRSVFRPGGCGGRTPAIVLTALAAASCDGSGGVEIASTGGGLTRLIGVAQEVEPADRTVVSVHKHVVVDGPLKDSPLIGASSRDHRISFVRPVGRSEDPNDFLPAFVVRGEGPKSVTFPCEFTRGQVSTAIAMISCYGVGEEGARAVLIDDRGKRQAETEWIEFERRREPRVLQFNFDRDPSSTIPMGGVMIEFEGKGKHAGLLSLELVDIPMAAQLPSLGAGATVDVESVSRTAAGLIEGSGWIADVESTGPCRIHLSLHAPERSSPSLPTVAVRVEGPEGRLDWSEKLPRKARTSWVDWDLDLEGLGEGTLRVSLEVDDGDDDQASAVLVGDATLVHPARDAPTILLITSDTHRADHLGTAFSQPFVDTPALDALAGRGLYFVDCQATTNITNPSHIAMMTGLHPRDTQIVDNRTALSASVPTLAETFQAAGYRTFGVISTQHLDHGQSGLGQGFDRFESTKDFKRRSQQSIARTIDWLEDADGEPVFVWLHLFDAHTPYAPPGAAAKRYYDGNPRSKDSTLDLGGVPVPGWIAKAGITDADYVDALYKGEVDSLDRALVDLLNLERVRAGHVAFTSDHGESFGMRGIWWSHSGLYLPMLDVPLILAGPGVPAVRSEKAVQQIDVGRTLLDLAGVDASFPGRNLVEVVEDDLGEQPRFAVAAHGLQASVTSGRWFLVLDLRAYDDDSIGDVLDKGRVQLFDRRNGVDGEEDVAMENLERTRRMRDALLAWLADANTEGFGNAIELSSDAAANLEALGYGGVAERTDAVWWTPEDVDPKWIDPFDE